MTNDEPARIIVAGGGIVGLAMSLAVKTHLGITPEVYDKASSLMTEGSGSTTLNSTAIGVLNDISPTLLQGVRGVGTECDNGGLNIIPSRVQVIVYSFALKMGINVQKKKAVLRVDKDGSGKINVTLGDGTMRPASILLQTNGEAKLQGDMVIQIDSVDIAKGLKEVGAIVASLKTHCMSGHCTINPANFAKAMTMYEDIRVNGAPITTKKSMPNEQTETEDESQTVSSEAATAEKSVAKEETKSVSDSLKNKIPAEDISVAKSAIGSLKELPPALKDDSQLGESHSFPDDVSVLTNPADDDQTVSTLGASVSSGVSNEFSLAPMGGTTMIWPGVKRSGNTKKSSSTMRIPPQHIEVSSEEAMDAVDYHFEAHSVAGSNSGSTRVYVDQHVSTDFGGRKAKVLNWLVDGITPHLKRLLVRPRAKLSAMAEAKVAAEWKQEGLAVVDEVQEILDVVQDAAAVSGDVTTNHLKLPRRYIVALHSLVLQFADGYRNNPFHNFGMFGLPTK